MKKQHRNSVRSAGVFLYRWLGPSLEVLLGHPGGPFYRNKDFGSWTIIKGEIDGNESAEAAARREFKEEVGFGVGTDLQLLGEFTQRNGKQVICFTAEFVESDDWLQKKFQPGTFSLEWPPKSGQQSEFPEIDRIEFFPIDVAEEKILPSQRSMLQQLKKLISRK